MIIYMIEIYKQQIKALQELIEEREAELNYYIQELRFYEDKIDRIKGRIKYKDIKSKKL